MRDYKIEKPNKSDYLEILSVWEASVRATHDFLKEEDIVYYRPLIFNQYLDAVSLYCIRQNNTLAGFMGLSASAIEMLFIHPSYRGMGIGRALLAYAVKDHGIHHVDVNEQNQQAVDFYKKMGFAISGRSDTDAAGKPYPILHMEHKPE